MTIHEQASHPEIALHSLQTNLSAVTPYMYGLADTLVEAAPEAGWDLLLCDDIGGRLPSHFISKVLGKSGITAPRAYVAGSRYHHDKFGQGAYEDYFKTLAERAGKKQFENVLVTTEVTSHGDTLAFLTDKLRCAARSIETASVVNKYPQEMTTTYVGESGTEAAEDIFYAFESLPPSSLRGKLRSKISGVLPDQLKRSLISFRDDSVAQPYNPLLGIKVTSYDGLPITRPVSVTPFTRNAYMLMENLADAYVASRGIGSKTSVAE